jgi:hypothetical protein
MREAPGTSTAREVGLLLATVPALLEAAVRLADPARRLALPEGRTVVTVGGEPRAFRSPAAALEMAERCADELHSALCLEAGRGGASTTARDALADLLGRFRPFRLEDCGDIRAELGRVRELAATGRAGSGEAAA